MVVAASLTHYLLLILLALVASSLHSDLPVQVQSVCHTERVRVSTVFPGCEAANYRGQSLQWGMLFWTNNTTGSAILLPDM